MSAHGEPASTCCHVSGGSNGMLDSVVGCRKLEWNGEWNGLWNGEWNGLWNGEWNGLWKGDCGTGCGRANGTARRTARCRGDRCPRRRRRRRVSTPAGMLDNGTTGWPAAAVGDVAVIVRLLMLPGLRRASLSAPLQLPASRICWLACRATAFPRPVPVPQAMVSRPGVAVSPKAASYGTAPVGSNRSIPSALLEVARPSPPATSNRPLESITRPALVAVGAAEGAHEDAVGAERGLDRAGRAQAQDVGRRRSGRDVAGDDDVSRRIERERSRELVEPVAHVEGDGAARAARGKGRIRLTRRR